MSLSNSEGSDKSHIFSLSSQFSSERRSSRSKILNKLREFLPSDEQEQDRVYKIIQKAIISSQINESYNHKQNLSEATAGDLQIDNLFQILRELKSNNSAVKSIVNVLEKKLNKERKNRIESKVVDSGFLKTSTLTEKKEEVDVEKKNETEPKQNYQKVEAPVECDEKYPDDIGHCHTHSTKLNKSFEEYKTRNQFYEDKVKKMMEELESIKQKAKQTALIDKSSMSKSQHQRQFETSIARITEKNEMPAVNVVPNLHFRNEENDEGKIDLSQKNERSRKAIALFGVQKEANDQGNGSFENLKVSVSQECISMEHIPDSETSLKKGSTEKAELESKNKISLQNFQAVSTESITAKEPPKNQINLLEYAKNCRQQIQQLKAQVSKLDVQINKKEESELVKDSFQKEETAYFKQNRTKIEKEDKIFKEINEIKNNVAVLLEPLKAHLQPKERKINSEQTKQHMIKGYSPLSPSNIQKTEDPLNQSQNLGQKRYSFSNSDHDRQSNGGRQNQTAPNFYPINIPLGSFSRVVSILPGKPYKEPTLVNQFHQRSFSSQRTSDSHINGQGHPRSNSQTMSTKIGSSPYAVNSPYFSNQRQVTHHPSVNYMGSYSQNNQSENNLRRVRISDEQRVSLRTDFKISTKPLKVNFLKKKRGIEVSLKN